MPFLPDVVQLGSFPLSMLALTGIVGGLLAYYLARWSAGRSGADRQAAGDVVLNLFVGGVLAAKLFYLVTDLPGHFANPAMLILFPYGPAALPAGALGGAAAVAWGLRRRPDWRAVLNAAAAPLALGLAVAAAGWKAPGTWAFPPLLAAAGLAGLGRTAPQAVLLACGALVLADLARPASAALFSGISLLQLAAAAAGTAAWAWERLQRK